MDQIIPIHGPLVVQTAACNFCHNCGPACQLTQYFLLSFCTYNAILQSAVLTGHCDMISWLQVIAF